MKLKLGLEMLLVFPVKEGRQGSGKLSPSALGIVGTAPTQPRATHPAHCALEDWGGRRGWAIILSICEFLSALMGGPWAKRGDINKKEQCEEEAKPFALSDKLIKENQMLGIEKAGLRCSWQPRAQVSLWWQARLKSHHFTQHASMLLLLTALVDKMSNMNKLLQLMGKVLFHALKKNHYSFCSCTST